MIIANGVLFFHAHELANGKIITHAHPILTEEQETLPNHGHTESELIILDMIAHLDYLILDYQIPLPKKSVFETIIFVGVESNSFISQALIGFDHRGPPAIV